MVAVFAEIADLILEFLGRKRQRVLEGIDLVVVEHRHIGQILRLADPASDGPGS